MVTSLLVTLCFDVFPSSIGHTLLNVEFRVSFECGLWPRVIFRASYKDEISPCSNSSRGLVFGNEGEIKCNARAKDETADRIPIILLRFWNSTVLLTNP